MSDINVTHLGSDENAEYTAYGDESGINNEFLTYAFIILKRSDIENVQLKIHELKNHYNIPQEIDLHFSKLFNLHQRNKLGLHHISETKLRSLIKRMIFIFNQTPIYLTFAYCNFKEYKTNFDKFNLKQKNEPNNSLIHCNPEPKGIQAFMAAYCIQAKPDHNIPPAEKCQIIISKEASLTRLFEKNRKQTQNWIKIRINNFEIHPYVLEAKNNLFLQIADMAAYMCVQAKFGDSDKANFFRHQLDTIFHKKESELFFRP